MQPPPRMMMVCPACPADAGAVLIELSAEQTEARCEQCGKRFSLVTRAVTESRNERVDAHRTRYQLLTQETAQRTRPRVFDAQPGLRVRAGSWVTLVYRGARLVGVADQTASVWFPVLALPPRSRHAARVLSGLGALCALLAALQLTRWAPQLRELLGEHGTAGAFALLLAVVFLAAPAVLFAAQTLRAGQPRRYLPASANTDIE